MFLKINTISLWTDRHGKQEVEPHPPVYLNLKKVVAFQINDEVSGFEDIYFICDGGNCYYFSVNEIKRDRNAITSKDCEFAITTQEFFRIKLILNSLLQNDAQLSGE